MHAPDHLSQLTTHFSQYISDHKKEFIEKVLADRTRHLTIVMENIYQSQNASAVVRTCECMGLQDIHVIENSSEYSTNPKVLKGANKWISLIRYNEKKVNNTESCFKNLRDRGYRVLVADPTPDGTPLGEISIDDKLAIVMGNELKGCSAYAIDHADGKVNIPMFGFTESMNISVSAAICINTLVTKIRASSAEWKLSAAEENEIRLAWYMKVVRKSGVIEREFNRRMIRD